MKIAKIKTFDDIELYCTKNFKGQCSFCNIFKLFLNPEEEFPKGFCMSDEILAKIIQHNRKKKLKKLLK